MKIRVWLSAVCLAAASLGAAAQQRLALGELVERLLEVNYALRIDELSVEVARNNVTPAPFLPSLTASARQNQQLEDGTTDVFGATATLSWRLFDGGAMFYRYDRSKAALTSAELAAYAKTEAAVGDLVAQYHYIVALAKRVELGEQTVRVSRERYSVALAKYQLEAASGLEMRLAKTDLNADSSSLIGMRQALDAAYIELNGMLNFDRTLRGYVSDTIAMDSIPSYNELRELCATHNTQVLLARNGQQISALELRAARAARYPTLDFGAAANGSWAAPGANRGYGSWGFTVGATLFNGMEVTRQIKNAKVEERRTELNAASVENNVMTSFHDQYLRYRNNLQLIGLENENASAMELNLSVAMERYRLEDLSGIDFRNIQLQYLSARERQITTVYQAKASEIGLLVLAGALL